MTALMNCGMHVRLYDFNESDILFLTFFELHMDIYFPYMELTFKIMRVSDKSLHSIFF